MPIKWVYRFCLFLNFRIMNHFYNKNCLDILKNIDDNYFDCCVTDPPYKIIAGWVRRVDVWDECSWILAKRDWRKLIPKNWNTPSAVKSGKMFEHNDIQFSEWLPELYRVMKPWTHTYIMINGRNLKDLQVEAEKVGFKFQNLLVWDKGNVTPNKYYMQGAEFILMLRKWSARNINNMGSSNVIRIPNIIWKKKHPTEKPVELYEYLLRNSTNPEDRIIDHFAGCWNVVIAGNNLWLDTTAIEIDEQYFNFYNSMK